MYHITENIVLCI